MPFRALLLALLLLVPGCARKETASPAEMDARFHALMESVDPGSPGTSIGRLQAFLRDHGDYPRADSVRAEIEHLRSVLRGRYYEARELARTGEFDQAEWILEDLARAPETSDGAIAKQHLEFEFYLEKAKWFLVRQRFEESESTARALLARDLDRSQADEVQQILDNVGLVGAAMEISSKQSLDSACRQLVVLMANIYINEGFYPEGITMAYLEEYDPHGFPFIRRQISTIEDYRASQDHYALVVVGKRGQRMRIEDGEIRPAREF